MLHKLSFALLFAVLTCAQIASAEIFREKGCLNVSAKPAFDWTAFQGGWFEQSRYPNIRQIGEKCVYSEFILRYQNTYAITVSGYYSSKEQFFFAMNASLKEKGILYITFADGTNRTDKILGTDYNSWAAIYSCKKLGNNGFESAWILTRESVVDVNVTLGARSVMKNNGVSIGDLQETPQHDCPRN